MIISFAKLEWNYILARSLKVFLIYFLQYEYVRQYTSQTCQHPDYSSVNFYAFRVKLNIIYEINHNYIVIPILQQKRITRMVISSRVNMMNNGNYVKTVMIAEKIKLKFIKRCTIPIVIKLNDDLYTY